MKAKSVVLAEIVCVLMFFAGCGEQNRKTSPPPWDPNVVWDGNISEGGAIPDFFEGETGEFPALVAGVWEAQLPDVLWDIKFEPNGSIFRIVHYVAGELKVEQGGVDANGPENSYYLFKLGPCEAKYSPDTRMLRAKIVIDYFVMKVPSGEIEGRMEDYFEGFVSEDGNRWDAQWFSFTWIKEATPPNIKEIKANPWPLVFIKLDPTKPREEMELQ